MKWYESHIRIVLSYALIIMALTVFARPAGASHITISEGEACPVEFHCCVMGGTPSFDCAGFTDTASGGAGGGACVSADYINSITGTESGGNYNCVNHIRASGRYQFIPGTRQGLCNNNAHLPCVSDVDFANCPALQDAYFQQFNRENWQDLQNCGATDQIGQTCGGVTITESCLLAMSHLGGAQGACNFANSCGGGNVNDGATSLSDYCRVHGNVPAFAEGGDCTVPPGAGGGGGGGGGGEDTDGDGIPDSPGPGGSLFCSFGLGCCPCTGCVGPQSRITMDHIVNRHNETRAFITEQFTFHENWFFGSNEFFMGARDSFMEMHVIPALMLMTEQLATLGMHQMLILGTFFDAKLQLETQQIFQKKVAEAHKDYHPTIEMCVIGTTSRGLAAAEKKGDLTSFILSQRSQDRQIGMYTANAAKDASLDREGRIRQVKERYCDPRDNSDNMYELCDLGKASPVTINKDIDYYRTIESFRSLQIDFTDGFMSHDEQDVLALGSNLFSHNVLDKPMLAPSDLEQAEGPYMEMRSIFAKRSVIENSYNSIVGLKTQGSFLSRETAEFTRNIIGRLGIDDRGDQLRLYVGVSNSGNEPANRPSYFAQMEALTQRIYHDPEFFTNLYDKPANVLRKDVAMQAINLMLERDMHKSELRSEMVLSIWLELELMKYQKDVQNQLNSLEEKYEEN